MHSELNFNIGHAKSNEFTTSSVFAPAAPSVLLFLPEWSACSRALFRAKNVVRAIHSVKRRQLHAGEMVFRQGEPGSSLYTVDEGVLDVIKEHEGVSRTVARLSPGEDQRVVHVPVYCAGLIPAVVLSLNTCPSYCFRSWTKCSSSNTLCEEGETEVPTVWLTCILHHSEPPFSVLRTLALLS